MRVCTYVAFAFFAALPDTSLASSLLQSDRSLSLRLLPLLFNRECTPPCHQELPSTLRSRAPEPYLTKDELVKVVRWKLWMGVVRPNLLRFATETDPKQVRTFTYTRPFFLRGLSCAERNSTLWFELVRSGRFQPFAAH